MPKRKSESDDAPAKLSTYTVKLTEEQLDKLEGICDRRAYGFYHVDYSRFAFKGARDDVNIVAYKSGKVVIQGKGTEAFVQNVIETEITGSPELGYEEVHHPEWYEWHAGLDEAGKGDFFGPLVSCCVIAGEEAVRAFREAGVKDSKTLTDASILRLEKIILKTKGVVVEKTWAGMDKYNQMMARPGANLNHLLAWYHAKALQRALEKRPVEWGMVDQFSKTPLTQRQLKKDGVDFDLRMQTKAEADPVVAAASICARAEYVRQLKKLSTEFGEELKKGVSAKVKEQGRTIVEKLGPHRLKDFAKVHFRTAYEVLGLPVPAKPTYNFGSRRKTDAAADEA